MGVARTHAAVRFLVLPFLFLSLYFYVLVRVQEGVLGRVVIAHEHVRIAGLVAVIAAIVFTLFGTSRVRVSEPRLTAFLAFYAGYLTIAFVARAMTGDTRLGALIYGYTYFYFFAFFALFLVLLAANGVSGPRVISERRAFVAFYCFAVTAFLIGYAQYLLNNSLFSVGSEESGYGVEVYLNAQVHHVRAFSLFGSAFTYGHVITLIATLALSWLLLHRRDTARRRVLYVGLLSMAVLAAVSTLTRNTYMEFALALAAVPLLKGLLEHGWTNSRIIGLAIGISIVMYAGLVLFFLAGRSLAGGILDLTTFAIRLAAVAAVTARFFLGGAGWSTILFGHGLMQGSKFAELQGIHPLLFDNTFVDVALFSGVIGLVLYLVFVVLVFSFVLRQYRRTRAYWWLALAGLYFSYPVVAAVNIHISTLFLLTCIVLCYDILATRRIERTIPASPDPANTGAGT